MKQRILIFILSLITSALWAQKVPVNPYAALDKIALQLPDSLSRTTEGIAQYISAHFKTDEDKCRAVFIWVASSIQYDVDNMFALNFYEKKAAKIEKALRTRKGICENYAAVFNEVCTKLGIGSFVVEGYTKQNGFTDYIPHAWCAALIGGQWFVFDPTWGSGYMNGGKFFKRINNDYYKAAPGAIIKSHMPFDYLWQFLHYPVTNQEFYEGRVQDNKSKPYFSYTDSIAVFEQQDSAARLSAEARRIEKNGVKNSLIFDRLQHIRLELEHNRQEQVVNLYNAALVDYNDGINGYNDFINYRNKQFSPVKEDTAIQNMLANAKAKLNVAAGKLEQIKNPDANTATLIRQMHQSVNDALSHVGEQEDWLKTYLSKGKSGRKSMFFQRKVSWMGIPLN